MSKVMTFSRVYPSYHPKAGQPTYFVEKIWNSIGFKNAVEDEGVFNTVHSLTGHDVDFIQRFFDTLGDDVNKKHHTIRAGHHWKVGDWFRPVVWGNDVNPKSGRSGPYHSKQITFAPDIQVKKVWDFYLVPFELKVNGEKFKRFDDLASNDGLLYRDFADWFVLSPELRKKKVFDGQIICWNENIEY